MGRSVNTALQRENSSLRTELGQERLRADNYLSAFRREQERAERLREELYRLKEQSALGAAGATRNRLSLEAEVQTWKDNHGLVVSDRDAWRARAEKAEAALQSLTPGGTEFYGAPDRCVAFVRERRDEAHRLALDLRSQRDSEHARAERAEADADEWYMLFQAEEDRAEKAEAERDEALKLAEIHHAGKLYTHHQATELLRREEEALRSAEARADRYLSAMREYVEARIAAMREYVEARIADGVCIPGDPPERFPAFERTVRATQAIRAIVEEATAADVRTSATSALCPTAGSAGASGPPLLPRR